ncbi:MAG: YjbE family putative metal transport protein [Hyphomicrobiaceae bacterium]
MLDWLQLNFVPLINVIIIDVVLAGDNAIIVGLAASRVKEELRSKVILWGIGGAVVLRIIFAALTTQLLAIVGLLLAGGLLLLWVCWKMYRELTHKGEKRVGSHGVAVVSGKPVERTMSFRAAVTQIIIADVSMSLDNVLAVAGAAKGDPTVLVIGLAIGVVLMAVAANYIADILARYPWITWIGLLVILYVALDMVFDGSREIACAAWEGVWCAPDLMSLVRGLLR